MLNFRSTLNFHSTLNFCSTLTAARTYLTTNNLHLTSSPSFYQALSVMPIASASKEVSSRAGSSASTKQSDSQRALSELEVERLLNSPFWSPGQDSINYNKGFPWSSSLMNTLEKVFNINQFKNCQASICNASIDGRNILVIMPTGSGKSVTYQLPAILSKGCALVQVSDKTFEILTSILQADQVSHLQHIGVGAAMLTAENKVDHAGVFSILERMVLSSVEEQDEIKLLYVAPEQLSKNQRLRFLLIQLAQNQLLSRIVLDEIHVLMLDGSDYRPAYLELIPFIRSLGNIPFIALTATLPSYSLAQFMQCLSIKSLLNGKDISKMSTLLFHVPINRANLAYAVDIKTTGERTNNLYRYILDKYKNCCGIIYCFTQKKTVTLAKTLSHGSITAGPYHASLSKQAKEEVHTKWKNNEINIVVATTAFGLGINKDSVRFVIHLSPPPNMIRLVQESGRAGRDNKKAACTIFYCPQDAVNISRAAIDTDNKLQAYIGHEVIAYCHNMETCRQILLARHFDLSAQISWLANQNTPPCALCDNCTRDPKTIDKQDVTLDIWSILKILQQVELQQCRTTLHKLAEAARDSELVDFDPRHTYPPMPNRHLGTVNIKTATQLPNTKKRAVDRLPLIVQWICVSMILQGYLKEDFQPAQQGTQTYVYLALGHKAEQLIKLSRAEIEDSVDKIVIALPVLKPTQFTTLSDTYGDSAAPGPSAPVKRQHHTSTAAQPQPDTDSDVEIIEPSSPSRYHFRSQMHARKRARMMADDEQRVIEISSDSE
ncbi:uncharacterized protein PHACADRAFT_27241 [Phanerochaete carnosa HHB-10118-sp]|uniref:ATP-dependent DNA helicase n=1 Tax=Phanerochaete carnosa (strain HHB-10118-sp) TaxID=650164 RepID=K5WAZ9_PHACS|nr:uncharacterized protein PHACADRAFT_27241 [Phanerochaete carnosa HHB-10118-sp]EKM56365.1 hypothetical protein PHACADRAFT_27241 [Phanerochaete carnosa HHB-10118-sp]